MQKKLIYRDLFFTKLKEHGISLVSYCLLSNLNYPSLHSKLKYNLISKRDLDELNVSLKKILH